MTDTNKGEDLKLVIHKDSLKLLKDIQEKISQVPRDVGVLHDKIHKILPLHPLAPHHTVTSLPDIIADVIEDREDHTPVMIIERENEFSGVISSLSHSVNEARAVLRKESRVTSWVSVMP